MSSLFSFASSAINRPSNWANAAGQGWGEVERAELGLRVEVGGECQGRTGGGMGSRRESRQGGGKQDVREALVWVVFSKAFTAQFACPISVLSSFLDHARWARDR